MTEKKIPVRLARDTIVESLFELRFSSQSQDVEDVLVGLLFGQLKDRFPRTEQLAAAMLPREMRQANLQLRYAATHRLTGTGIAVIAGPRVFGLSCAAPYIGWAKFKKEIESALHALDKTGLVDTVERYSLRYVNLIPCEQGGEYLRSTELKCDLGGLPMNRTGFEFRAEVNSGPHVSVVTIKSAIDIARPTAPVATHGLLVDIDTIRMEPDGGKKVRLDALALDEVHVEEKRVYVNILTEDQIAALGPEY